MGGLYMEIMRLYRIPSRRRDDEERIISISGTIKLSLTWDAVLAYLSYNSFVPVPKPVLATLCTMRVSVDIITAG